LEKIHRIPLFFWEYQQTLRPFLRSRNSDVIAISSAWRFNLY
jgi:hypothetical protein